MKKVVAILMLIFVNIAHAAPDVKVTLQNGKIDSRLIMKGLSIGKKEQGKSDNGRLRSRWKINGTEFGTVEIIGNNQADADLLGGSCSEFNKAGNEVWPWTKNSNCRKLFVKLMENTVDKPEQTAEFLIKNATQKAPQCGEIRIGDISIELSKEGGYFFIRRWSRINRSY
jgi:hypothetical protein